VKNWISGAITKPGALHRTLGVPAGKKIPGGLLDQALHSKDPTTRKRAQLAKMLRKVGR
jgi:hypothetical protein